jgi:predicted membrane protein (TIGR00267 family)
VVAALRQRPAAWRDFMLRFELGLEQPDPARARTSAFVIGSAYLVGGFIPLLPYMSTASVSAALPWSVGVTLLALGVFGFVKGRFTGARPWKSALQTMLIGGLAAAAAFLIARAVS